MATRSTGLRQKQVSAEKDEVLTLENPQAHPIGVSLGPAGSEQIAPRDTPTKWSSTPALTRRS